MVLTWNDVTKIIAILTGTGLSLASLSALVIWIFKEWVLNLFRKDLKKQEIKLQEQIKEKENIWAKENKAVELRLGEEIRKSELQITKLINFEQKHFDLLLTSYQGTWEKLIDFEDFMIREFPFHLKRLSQLPIADINDVGYPIREKIKDIRKSFLFLPKETSDKVSNLIEKFSIDFDGFLKVIETSKQNTPVNSEGKQLIEGQGLQPINVALNTVQTNLNKNIDSLKESFQTDYMKKINNNS